ncbi:hypothetical protein KY340_00530 [Candidatus Woesearchaeota archaeon]|nr:hypothetical protein [Candidatus Woesearchaeota archaeon]
MVRVSFKADFQGGGLEKSLRLLPDGKPSLTDEVFEHFLAQELQELSNIERRGLVFHQVAGSTGKATGKGIYFVSGVLMPFPYSPQERGLFVFSFLYGIEEISIKELVRDATDKIAHPSLKFLGEATDEMLAKAPVNRELAMRGHGFNVRTTYGFYYIENK